MADTTLVLTISGNTTLTSAQAANGGYEFSGTLSAAATITWPSYAGMASVQNKTAGGFPINCRISSGASVTVLNGETVALWSDGTTFARLSQFGGGTSVSGSGPVVLATAPTLVNGTYNPNNTLSISSGTSTNHAGISMTMVFEEGTASSPIATKNGNELGFIQCYGFDGTTINQASPNAWVFVATEDWTPTKRGCVTKFQATPNGSIVGQQELCIGNGVIATLTDGPAQGLGRGTINALAGLFDNGNRVLTTIPLMFSGGSASQGPGQSGYYGSGLFTGGGAGSSITIPIAGKLGNLYVNFSNAPGASQSYTATMVVGGVATSVQGIATGSGMSCSDITHTYSAGAGQAMFLKVDTSAGAATLGGLSWGFTIAAP